MPGRQQQRVGGNATSARITAPDANSDCASGSNNICSHGTHVAGIVAGSDGGSLHGVAGDYSRFRYGCVALLGGVIYSSMVGEFDFALVPNS